MKRCPVFSSVSPEQCREPEGHPQCFTFRFHRFSGPLAFCEDKSYCAGPDGHEGECRTEEDQAHVIAHPDGCGNRGCFVCVLLIGNTLPEGFPGTFPFPKLPGDGAAPPVPGPDGEAGHE